MPKERSRVAQTEKEGWLSLQGSQGLARPVRAVLNDTALVVYTGTIPAVRSVTPPISSPSGTAAGSASVQGPGLTAILYRSTAAPHPDLRRLSDSEYVDVSSSTADQLGISAEAIAHDLLFGEAPPKSYAALVLSAPVYDVAAALHLYLELLLAGGLEGAPQPGDILAEKPQLDVRVVRYCEAVLEYPSLVLNTHVLSAVLKLNSSLDSLDSHQANNLKLSIMRAQESAQRKRDLAFANEERLSVLTAASASSAKSQWSDRLVKAAHASQGLPPDLIADSVFAERFVEQIALFHRRLFKYWSPQTDQALLFHTKGSSSVWPQNPLVFDPVSNPAAPHFLGLLAAQHAFSYAFEEQMRGRLLEQWVRIAARLRTLGDSVGWIAIISILFDMPVLRLSRVWRFVDRELLARVAHDWGYELFERRKRADIPFLSKAAFRTDAEGLGRTFAREDYVTYFGDAIVKDAAPTPERTAQQLERISAIVEGWQAYSESVPDDTPPSRVAPDARFQAALAEWAQQPPTRTDLTELSLNAQPRLLGYYLPYFNSQVLPLTTPGAILPLLFSDAMPSFRLFPLQTLKRVNDPKDRARPTAPAEGIAEVDDGAREQIANSDVSVNNLARIVRDVLNVGADTVATRAGVVFKSFPSDEHSNSRNSRTSSIVESIGRRTLNGRQVVVKNATLLGLVDVLVLGASPFGSGLVLDRATHTATLLATYRSFCSPIDLLSMLLVRVRGARACSRLFAEDGHLLSEPSVPPRIIWVDSKPSDAVDTTSTTIVGTILATLSLWIKDYFFDFTDDARVLDAGRGLLSALRTEVASASYAESIVADVKRVTSEFLLRQYSVNRIESPPSWTNAISERRYGRVPELPVTSLDVDGGLGRVEALVDELDVLVADAFSRITMVDWMKLFEVLELQAATPVGLFYYDRSPKSNDADAVVIQDVYSWLSTLHSAEHVRVLELLPEPIVALIRLHFGLVQYFTLQIADPGIAHPHDRRERMSFLLKMLGVLRARMQFFALAQPEDDDPGCPQTVPSFLDRAIVAAIVRPESRAYSTSWLATGAELSRLYPNCNVSSICPGSAGEKPNERTIFVPRVGTLHGRTITPCVGWVAERLLEIVSCVPNTSVDHPHLINFDKRRYAYNLVKNISDEFNAPAPVVAQPELVEKHSYLLGKTAKSGMLVTPMVEYRAHKESVARDAAGKSRPRVFVDVVAQETEKARSEARQYARLSSSDFSGLVASNSANGIPKSQSYTSLNPRRWSRIVPHASTQDVPSAGLDIGGPLPMPTNVGGSNLSTSAPSSSWSPQKRTPQPQRRHLLGGLMMKAVRPLSMLGGSHSSVSTPSVAPIPPSASLYAQQSGSASSLQSQPDESDNGWVNDDALDLSAQLPLSEYGSNDWQMVSQIDIANICNVESRDGSMFSVTFRTGSKPETAMFRAESTEAAREWADVANAVTRRVLMESSRVFGVPLDIVCEREGHEIPAFFETLLSQIEQRGLDEVGVYRISGSLAAVNALKQLFDQGKTGLKADDPRWSDINAVAGCVKLYLRELPQSVLTLPLLPEFLKTVSPVGVDVDRLRAVINMLPPPNYHVLKRLSEHLRLIVDHSVENKMNLQNIAIVFSVNLLPPLAMNDMGGMQQLVGAFVTQYDNLFGV